MNSGKVLAFASGLLLGLVMAGLGFVVISANRSADKVTVKPVSQQAQTATTHDQRPDSSVPVAITFGDVGQMFSSNEFAARSELLGKRISITGSIGNIYGESQGWSITLLDDSDPPDSSGKPFGAIVRFSSETRESALHLHADERVTCVGTIRDIDSLWQNLKIQGESIEPSN